MWQFCNKNKGAISVFLTLILIPVLILGCLTTDAARIYASKAVISDAGEMAMNAALAQYDKDLLDEYGLFIMSRTPESMEDDLEGYFNASLNGTGIDGADDYDKILDLVTEQFSAVNLEASKIYKSDVEKQQIVEYMKYRAPVCLTELLLEKLDVIKDTKKLTEATQAQLEFAEAMEDCHDAMEEAKLKLDDLNAILESVPFTPNTIGEALDETKAIYTGELSKSLLMLAAISHYTKSADMDGESAARSYVAEVGKIDLGDPTSPTSFESYMDSLYYRESAGRLSEVISEKRRHEPDAEDEAHGKWRAELDALKELEEEYNEAKDKASRYPGALRLRAKSECIDPQTELLSDYYQKALQGAEAAEIAVGKLEIVKEKLEAAAASFQKWSGKVAVLPENDSTAGMRNSVKEYEDFFGTGKENEDNLSRLSNLLKNVENDQTYFTEISVILKEQKFFGLSIATTSADIQYTTYLSKANAMVGSNVDQYAQILDLKDSYTSNYVKTEVSTSCEMQRIYNDPFYLKLIEYCNLPETEESKKEKTEANKNLEGGKKASEEAESEEGYPDYQWTLDDTMPSVALAKGAENADKLASVDGNVNGKSGRKEALSKAKESISKAAGFWEKLDHIVSEGVSNLYVAEYAMQMFSYYTVDKTVNSNGIAETIPEDQVISMSGYKMSGRDAYKAEVEYILWGKAESQTNIRNTVMTIFGIRLLLNSLFAFSNATIARDSRHSAILIAGSAPYLIPVIQAIIQFGFACVETADDIARIKEGYGVVVLKEEKSWKTYPLFYEGYGDNTKGGLTLDYSEFLRIFLNINMLGSLEKNKLARIADCIQQNSKCDLLQGYTMLAIEAKVKARTTFMKKISDNGSGGWISPDNYYSIQYQSILGY